MIMGTFLHRQIWIGRLLTRWLRQPSKMSITWTSSYCPTWYFRIAIFNWFKHSSTDPSVTILFLLHSTMTIPHPLILGAAAIRRMELSRWQSYLRSFRSRSPYWRCQSFFATVDVANRTMGLLRAIIRRVRRIKVWYKNAFVVNDQIYIHLNRWMTSFITAIPTILP